MHLLFVADGPRDEVTIPRLVETILNTKVEVSFLAWKGVRLNRGSGYKRKLRFVLAKARDQELDGLVATVDCDKSPPGERQKLLREARDDDRKKIEITQMPAALGEAIPHAEAWLLDDEKAIREVLQIAGDQDISPVNRKNPKDALNNLMMESGRQETSMNLLQEIAANVDRGRCNHASETGFDAFVQEVQKELSPIVDPQIE